MTSQEIAESLAGGIPVIVPVAPTEPYGAQGATGSALVCTRTIADEISSRRGWLVAPLIPYACSTGYMAFAGTGALRPDTVRSIIRDLLKSWIFQGARRIVILNGSIDSAAIIDQALHQTSLSHPAAALEAFTWPQLPAVVSFVAEHGGSNDYRREFALLSMAAYIRPGFIREETIEEIPASPASAFERWQKRGRDPEQFRKHFPRGTTYQGSMRPDKTFGRSLLDFVVQTIEARTRFNSDIPPDKRARVHA